MHKRFSIFLILLLSCLFPLSAHALELPQDGLPSLVISSDTPLQVINSDKANRTTGHMELYDAFGQLICEREITSFHMRGATSCYRQIEKKPYNMKLSLKAELIPDAGKAKKWSLLSGDMYDEFVDWTHNNPLLLQILGFQLYEDLGGKFSLGYMPVSLYDNDDYRGVYLLTEATNVGKNRVHIRDSIYDTPGSVIASETIEYLQQEIRINYYQDAVLSGDSGGFLIELDSKTTESAWFETSWHHIYSFKEPKYPTREQIIQIAEYVQNVEEALYSDSGFSREGKYFTEYLDMDSFIARLAVDEMLMNCDAFLKSCFFCIDVDERGDFSTKLIAGPAWDYDGADLDSTDFLANTGFLKQIVKHGEITARLYELSMGELKDVWGSYLGEDGLFAAWVRCLTPAEQRNHERWPSSADFLGDVNTRLSASAFLRSLASRGSIWYSRILQENRLLGVTASWDDEKKTIVPTVYGSDDYTAEFCLVDSRGKLAPVDGTTLSPGSTYVVKVTNNDETASLTDFTNQSYGSVVNGHPVGSVMFSNPVVCPE